MVEPVLADMGFALVRCLISGGVRRPRLQIMAEPVDGREMRVEDCEEISRRLSAILDVEDAIKGAYDLEISSPGLDRPLTRFSDYTRFAGQVAKVELRAPQDGRKQFRGRLSGAEGENIVLTLEDGSRVDLPFAEIGKAKLVLTEDVIRAALRTQDQKRRGE